MAKEVAVGTLNPGRSFIYPWNKNVEGEVVRQTSGGTTVTLKRTEEVTEIGNDGNEYKRTKVTYERNVTITGAALVYAKNNKSKGGK